MKFWKGTRKVKAVKEEDYQCFKGKGRAYKPKPVLASDSDSDFETLPKIHMDFTSASKERRNEKKEIITIDSDKLDTIDQRLKNLEAEFSSHTEVVRLQEQIAKLEADNHTMSKCVGDVKESFNCIICQTVANFPWMVTLCCSVLMCRNCFDTWSAMQPTCPHCRATLSSSTCQEVRCIRALEQQIAIWRGNTSDSQEPQTD